MNEEHTYLNAAIKSGKWEIVNALIEAGAPLTLMGKILNDKEGPVYGNAIHAAVITRKNEILQKLLTISPYLIESFIIPSPGSPMQKYTPVMLAITFKGDMIEIVQTLFSHGAYFNANDPKFPGFNLSFTKACNHGNVKIFDFLVKNYKINFFSNSCGGKSLYEVIKKSKVQVYINWLIQNKSWIEENKPKQP